MAATRPKYSKEEFARRGRLIFEKDIRPLLDATRDDGKFVLVDIETGDFEIDANEMAASTRLRARRPKGQVWMLRVGRKAARRFGGRMVTPS